MKTLLALAAVCATCCAAAEPPRDSAAGEQRFRAFYKELVETNTTLSAGSCTLAAERMAARLKAAGLPDGDLHPFAAPDHPQGRRPGRRLSGPGSEAEGDPAARPHRRRGGQARGLDARSVHPDRGERLLLCARRDRRQGEAAIWVDTADPLSKRELSAAAYAQDGAYLRRGDRGCVQRRRVAHPEPPRTDRRRVRAQRGRLGRARRERAAASPIDIQAGEKISAELSA